MRDWHFGDPTLLREIYAQHDVLRTRVLEWVQRYRFVGYAIISSDVKLDQFGLHVQAGALQPKMLAMLNLASICRSWYAAALAIVQNKPWISTWRTARRGDLFRHQLEPPHPCASDTALAEGP